MQSSHNIGGLDDFTGEVQSYHNISKNAIKSQHVATIGTGCDGAKLPQYFKECNQVTTIIITNIQKVLCKVTTIFQRMQSSHN